MIEKTIPYTDRLGFSRLFRDFVYNTDPVANYFHSKTYPEIAADLTALSYDRERIYELLDRQNRAWGAPAQVTAAVEKTKSRDAVMIFTGQQAGLFGGPYLVLLKALGAVKLARKLEIELKRPVIPVFWIAADDHDFLEISHAGAFDQGGNIAEININSASAPGLPVGALQYDDAIKGALDKVEALLPDNEFKANAIGPLREFYQEKTPIVDSFARYLLSVAGRFGIVPFNPYDADCKKIGAPLYREVIDQHEQLKQRLIEIEKRLVGDGYHLQVEKVRTALHLFHHHPHRDALHKDGDAFVCGDLQFSYESLVREIESNPINFSTDVITRPILQSYLFPTLAIMAGPAEIAYYAQLLRLFDLFDLPAPRIVARPSATLVEARFERYLEEYNLSFDDLSGDIEGLINSVFRDTFPQDYQNRFDRYRESVVEGIRELREELIDYDKNLQPMIDRTREKIDYQLNELDKKIFAAHKKKHKTERERLYRLHDNLLPNRNLAERSIAPFYFVSRYGPQIFDFIFKNLQITETGHQLLWLSKYNEHA